MASEHDGARVLIVDDDETLCEVLRRAFTREGLTALCLYDGLDLVARLKEFAPDLVLLDVHLSWIDGFELCRLIRRQPQFAQVPVIFVSGLGDPRALATGKECGAVDYITKPFDLPDLLARVKRHLNATPHSQP
jgi:DNA-binding response OmpR family regulator